MVGPMTCKSQVQCPTNSVTQCYMSNDLIILHRVFRFCQHVDCVYAALQFSQTLADLETAQSQVSAHLKSHYDVVTQVTTTS